MSRPPFGSLLFACLIATSALADAPAPAAAVPPTAATAAPAPAAPPADSPRASATRSDSPTDLDTGGLTQQQVTAAFAKFRKQTRDGQQLYCRKEVVLGSRLGTTVCYTEEQVLANARAERDAQNMMSQRSVCGSAGGCASQ